MNMNISNNITAPILLVAAMLILILFQSVFFVSDGVIYTEPAVTDGSVNTNIANAGADGGSAGDFIIYNNIKYKPDKFFILTVISDICAFLLTAVFYVKLKGDGYLKNLKLNLPRNLKYLPLSIYMFFMLISGVVLINSLLFYSGGAAVNPENVLPFIIDTGGNPVYDMGVLISLIILPAFCEEFFFRSVLSAEYEKYGAFCAVMITSSAFALSHFSFEFFPSYFFAGLILYITAKATNSVLFAVILHAGYNFFNIYLWDKLSGVLTFEQNRFIFMFIAAIIFIGSLYFVLDALEIIYYKKAYNNEPSPVYSSKGKNKSAWAVNFIKSLISPFLAAVVIFFIYINI